MSLTVRFLVISISLGLMNLAINILHMGMYRGMKDRSVNNLTSLTLKVKKSFVFTETSHWSTIVPEELYVYSAYLDSRITSPVVKVIAASSRDTYKCLCRFWHLGNNTQRVVTTTDGKFDKLPDTGGR